MMKRTFFLLSVIFTLSQAAAQQVTIDSSFSRCNGVWPFNCFAIQPDNKMIIGQQYIPPVSGPVLLFRINEDGSVDSTFNEDTLALDYLYEPSKITVQNDGKIIVSGAYDGLGTGRATTRIVRLNSDGSMDQGFGIGYDDSIGCIITGITVQPDNKILISGGVSSYNGYPTNALARLYPDGTLDTAFTTHQNMYFYNADQWSTTVPRIYSLILQPDQKILVCGDFGRGIQRVNPDGSYDAAFENNIIDGFEYADNSGQYAWVNAMAIQPDGKIIAGGYFSQYNNQTANTICRLNPDGTLDTTFSSGAGFDDLVESIAIESDGKILVGGLFQTYNGDSCTSLARLNSDGSLDTTFNHGSGLGVGQVLAIGLDGDGRLCAGGNFFTFDGTAIPTDIERFILHIPAQPVDTDSTIISVNDNIIWYPNPTTANCTISSTDTITEIRIIDMLGKMASESTPLSTQATVDLSMLSTGLYFARVEVSGRQYVLRVIKE